MAKYSVTLDPDRTIETVLKSLGDLIEYELAVVMSFEGRSELRVRKAMGPLYTDRLQDYSISLDRHADLARIIEARKPYLFSQDEQHIDTYYEVLDLPDGHSCLVAPLYFKDTPIGLLTLDHRACNMFTQGIVKLIGTLSDLISTAIVSAEATKRLSLRNKNLLRERNNLLEQSAGALKELVGISARWHAVLDATRLVAGSAVPVLIQGETGTGKELVARTVHRLSDRSRGPFVPLNCSALTASLVESELFGHEKGAFTGANVQRKGRFELADGGTLFLDEIGDLPLEIQPKLLRVLQDGMFERVGGENPVQVDTRIIAATNVDLAGAVESGRFREDLYYRLAVYPIIVPPLRDRPEDILPLVQHFIERIRSRAGADRLALSDAAAEMLISRRWSGNVRELQNAVERAALLCGGGVIRTEHVTQAPSTARLHRTVGPEADGLHAEPATGRQDFPSLDEVQRRHIQAALALAGGRIYGRGGAAELLAVKPSTLQSKMKRLNIVHSASP